MNQKKLKEDLESKIINNQVQEVFEILLQVFESDTDKKKIILARYSEWNEIVKKGQSGIKSTEQTTLKKEIKGVLIEFIEEISEQQATNYYNQSNAQLQEKQKEDATAINTYIPDSNITYRELYVLSDLAEEKKNKLANLGEDTQNKANKSIDIYEDFLSDKQSTEKIWIIEGKPGQGKSTFIMHIQNEYATKEHLSSKILLKIKGDDLFWSDFEKTTARNYIEAQVKELANSTPDKDYIILLDGWDEINGDYTLELGEKVLRDLQKASYKTLITSREDYFDNIGHYNRRKSKHDRIRKLVLVPHNANKLKAIITKYEQKKNRTSTSEKLLGLLDDDKYVETFSNCTGLLTLLLINETDLDNIELTENNFIDQVIRKRYSIIGKEGLKKQFNEENYEECKKLLSFMAFKIESTGGEGINLEILSIGELKVDIDIEALGKIFPEQALISAGYLRRKSGKLIFVLSLIREYLCAFFINNVLENMKNSYDEEFLSTFQILFEQKVYTAQTWNYLKNFIKNYDTKKTTSLLKLLHDNLPFVLNNQGLNKYASTGKEEKGPILRSINTFSAYWRIYNLLAKEPINIESVKQIQQLKYCISLVQEDHIHDRISLHKIAWNKLPEALFKGLNYNNTDFSGSDFSGKTFSYCVFSKCLFNDVTFNDVTFKFCDFNQASFTNLTFNECTFSHSETNGATFTKVDFEGVEISNSYFNKATLKYCDLKNSILKNSEFQGCTFDESEITDSSFDTSKLKDAKFLNTTFNKIQFPASDLSLIHFEQPKGLLKESFTDCENLDGAKGLPEKLEKEIASDKDLVHLLDKATLAKYTEDNLEIEAIEEEKQRRQEEAEKKKKEEERRQEEAQQDALEEKDLEDTMVADIFSSFKENDLLEFVLEKEEREVLVSKKIKIVYPKVFEELEKKSNKELNRIKKEKEEKENTFIKSIVREIRVEAKKQKLSVKDLSDLIINESNEELYSEILETPYKEYLAKISLEEEIELNNSIKDRIDKRFVEGLLNSKVEQPKKDDKQQEIHDLLQRKTSLELQNKKLENYKIRTEQQEVALKGNEEAIKDIEKKIRELKSIPSSTEL